MLSPFIVIPAISTPQELWSGEIAHIWAIRKPIDQLHDNPATKIDVKTASIESEATFRSTLHVAVGGSFQDVGDFIWPVPFTDCVTKRDIALQIMDEFRGFEMVKTSIVTKSGKPNTKAQKARLELAQLVARQWVSLDRSRTSYRDEDGRAVIYGLEWCDFTNEMFDGRAVVRRHPRTPGKGYYIKAVDLDGCDVFHVKDTMGVLCCTDRFRDFVLSQGFSNIDFCEVGSLI